MENSSEKPKESHTILVMGLDESGKTSIFNHYFFGELFAPAPTDVFEENLHEFYGHNLNFREIGGRYRFKPQRYDNLSGSKAIIWVFDSIDQYRRTESFEELDELLKREEVANLPLLFIVNKQDSKFAMPWEDIENTFKFEEIRKSRPVNYICTTSHTCQNVTEGLLWLLTKIGLEPVYEQEEPKEQEPQEDEQPRELQFI